MRPLLTLWAGLLVAALAGCAAHHGEQAPDAASTGKAVAATGQGDWSEAPDEWEDVAEVKVSDPIEPVNRGVFWFNHQLYTYIAKPFSSAYRYLLPDLVRRGVRNAYDNVRFPVRFVNHTLQGRLDRTVKETGKFAVNTTAGVGGVMTPADKIPALAEVPRADTAQTFAKWGIPSGPYLVFPLLGPTTCRELAGTVGDTALNPLSWISLLFPGAAWTLGVTAPGGAHTVPDQMDRYDTATKDALDPYISARTGFIQYRAAQSKK